MMKEKEKEVQNYRYTRVYTDESGETHFEDVEIELLPTIFAPPAPALNLSQFLESKRYGFVNAPSGWFGDWHPTPKRQVFIYLSGEMEAKVSDGEVRLFGPSSVTLVEDTTGKGHVSRVIGDQDVLAVVIQLED
ncbi:MAG: cupin domain-containing protein [Candidatus Thorarchaeota archaeon]